MDYQTSTALQNTGLVEYNESTHATNRQSHVLDASFEPRYVRHATVFTM